MLFVFKSELDLKIERASDLVANSFLNTSSYTEIFRGNEADRLEKLKFMFNKNIHMIHARCEDTIHYYHSETGELECFFIMIPKDLAQFSLCEKIGAGLLEFPFRCGFDATDRMVKLSDWYDKVETEIMGDYPNYLHLERMTVSPKRQGLSYFCC